jgi:hypothetical protein
MRDQLAGLRQIRRRWRSPLVFCLAAAAALFSSAIFAMAAAVSGARYGIVAAVSFGVLVLAVGCLRARAMQGRSRLDVSRERKRWRRRSPSAGRLAQLRRKVAPLRRFRRSARLVAALRAHRRAGRGRRIL